MYVHKKLLSLVIRFPETCFQVDAFAFLAASTIKCSIWSKS